MHDKNPAIRKVCDACLDVIAVSSSDLKDLKKKDQSLLNYTNILDV